MAKRGEITIWHWAHLSDTTDCTGGSDDVWRTVWTRWVAKGLTNFPLTKDGRRMVSAAYIPKPPNGFHNGRYLFLRSGSIPVADFRAVHDHFGPGNTVWIINARGRDLNFSRISPPTSHSGFDWGPHHYGKHTVSMRWPTLGALWTPPRNPSGKLGPPLVSIYLDLDDRLYGIEAVNKSGSYALGSFVSFGVMGRYIAGEQYYPTIFPKIEKRGLTTV